MANVLTGATLAAVGNLAIKPLRKAMPALTAFTTNISPQTAWKGSTIKVPLLTAITAADPNTSGYKAALTDFNTSAVTVTLAHKAAGFRLSENEMGQIGDNLEGGFIQAAANEAIKSIVDEVVDAAFALVTSGNFTNAYTKAAASADQDDITLAQKQLKDLGGVPDAILANTTLWAEIVGLNVTVDKTDVFETGTVKKCFGSDLYECPTLIATGNLIGAVMDRSAIAIAVRPTGNAMISNALLADEIITEPTTGLSVRYTSWIDVDTRSLCVAYECVYGAAVGNGAGLVRWISA